MTPARPGGLRWLYVLLVATTLALGANVGSLSYFGDRTTVAGYAANVTRCARAYLPNATVAGLATAAPQARAGFLTCTAPEQRVRAARMAGGAATTAAGLVALMFLVPLTDRWRIRRRRWPDSAEIARGEVGQRFAAQCERLGLTGRGRPRLVVVGSSVRQAFTSAAPRSRPWVVVPVALTLPSRRTEFEAVVGHELGHITARDARWVAMARGVWLLILPAVLLGVLPELVANGPTSAPRAAAVRALVLTTSVLLLAAAVLRSRELDADTRAAVAGHRTELLRLLAGSPSGTTSSASARRGLLPRAFGRHPAPARRVANLRGRVGGSEMPFVRAVAVAAVAALAGGAARELVSALTIGSVPARAASTSASTWAPTWAAIGTAALLLGLLPLRPGARPTAPDAVAPDPAASEAAASEAPQGSWRTPLGAATGLSIGGFLAPGTNGSDLASVGFLMSFTNRAVELVTVAVIAAFCAGATYLAAGIAAIVPRPFVYLGSVGVFAGTLGMVSVPVILAQAAADQIAPSVALLLPTTYWPELLLAPPVLATLAGVGHRVLAHGRPLPELTRALRSAVPLIALAAGAAGVCLVRWAMATTPDALDAGTVRAVEVLHLRDAAVCSLAGVAAFWLHLAGRRRAFAGGVTAAFGTTAVSAGLTLAGQLATDRMVPSWISFRFVVLAPLAWLALALPLMALTALVATLLPPRGLRRRTGTGRSALTAVVVGCLVAVVGISANLDFAIPSAVPQAVRAEGPAPDPDRDPGPVAVPSPQPPAGSARPLTGRQARWAAGAVGSHLPPYWRAVDNETESPTNPTIRPPSCAPYARETYGDVGRNRRRAMARRTYRTLPPDVGVVRSTLTIDVWSFAEPAPKAMFVAAARAEAACRSFTYRTGENSITFDVLPDADIGFVGTERVWRTGHTLRLGGLRGESHTVLVATGNVIVRVILFAVQERPDRAVLDQAVTWTLAAARVQAPSGP